MISRLQGDKCFLNVNGIDRGTRQRSWLRHYVTSRKVAGSLCDEVVVFLN
jgi:hypothetical protein